MKLRLPVGYFASENQNAGEWFDTVICLNGIPRLICSYNRSSSILVTPQCEPTDAPAIYRLLEEKFHLDKCNLIRVHQSSIKSLVACLAVFDQDKVNSDMIWRGIRFRLTSDLVNNQQQRKTTYGVNGITSIAKHLKEQSSINPQLTISLCQS